MSNLIKGGRAITAADDYVGDVFVEDEGISLIGESLDVEAERVENGELVARPGVGRFAERARFGEEFKPAVAVH